LEDAVGATPAPISLAWMLHKKDCIAPIPGSRKSDRIEEKPEKADVELTDAEYAKIKIQGNRTDEGIAKLRSLK
jgi:aryl-alcohol dehydrogenase-like predicted oxidoreductase